MIKKITLLATALLIAGCSEIHNFYNKAISPVTEIADPTERGLTYVAMALIISAVIRGFLNR